MLLMSTYVPNEQFATHAPFRSSPLRERSINTGASLLDFSMTSRENEKQVTQLQRAHKPNPVLQTRDAATKRRREMFFQRVQSNREDKKWESRGEQLQQLEFVSERKRWESKKAQEAPPEEDSFDDELLSDVTLPQSSSRAPQPDLDMTEADYLLALEEYELQQLIASMETEQNTRATPQQHYGSDDEDYDQIFMACATESDTRSQLQSYGEVGGHTDADDMDMTDG